MADNVHYLPLTVTSFKRTLRDQLDFNTFPTPLLGMCLDAYVEGVDEDCDLEALTFIRFYRNDTTDDETEDPMHFILHVSPINDDEEKKADSADWADVLNLSWLSLFQGTRNIDVIGKREVVDDPIGDLLNTFSERLEGEPLDDRLVELYLIKVAIDTVLDEGYVPYKGPSFHSLTENADFLFHKPGYPIVAMFIDYDVLLSVHDDIINSSLERTPVETIDRD